MSLVSSVRRRWADWVGKYQYAVGKRHQKRGHYEDALEAFEAAEQWLAVKYGPQLAYVVSALIKQGLCNAMLNRMDAACRVYRRALAIVDVTVGGEHPMAHDLRRYLASTCTDRGGTSPEPRASPMQE